jgi:hypothetical protein
MLSSPSNRPRAILRSIDSKLHSRLNSLRFNDVGKETVPLLDCTRRLHAAPTTAATSTGQAADDDVEEGNDAVDDGCEDGTDAVDDGHEDVTDRAELEMLVQERRR